MTKRITGFLLCMSSLMLLPLSASAVLESGVVVFENLDTPPLYFKATVAYQVYAPGDAASPIPSTADFTYVYTLSNNLVTPPAGQVNIPLDRLEVGVGSSAIVSLTTSTGTGTAPTSINTTVPTKVGFLFGSFITPGASSNQLVIQSPSGPGDVTSTVGFGGSVDDQLLRGPFALPQANFACFDVNKIEIKVDKKKAGNDEIEIEKGVISLEASKSFNPTTDIVKLDLNNGAYVLSIPAGSFERHGAKEDFRYKTGSGVSPSVHARINITEGEWEIKIGKTNATMISSATSLDVMLMVADMKGQVTVPLGVKKDDFRKKELEFKRQPKAACVVHVDDDTVSGEKRSCLSVIEVTYQMNQPTQEVLRKFSGEIGHPETTFVTSSGASVTFNTSGGQCLQCGQTDLTGKFTITGISDVTGKLATQCGFDPNCDTTPSAPGTAGWQCLENSDCISGTCSVGFCQ